jgi:DNA polymerase/3'-5' exonuclease PolX
MPSTEATATRIPRPEAISAAKAFVGHLDGTYDQLIVGGSLRRRLAFVHDVEIVAVPTIETVVGGLFGDERSEIDRLDEKLISMLEAGEIEKRLDRHGTPRWGSSLRYATFQGVRFDLFTPCAERFGWILLLRTGPEAFSRQLVMPRGRQTRDGRPGLLPPLIVPRDGWLSWRVSGERIETRDEQSVFELFKLSYQEPWERS